MALPYELDHVRRRSGMWIHAASFDTLAAFIQGADMVAKGGILTGFREWLTVKVDCANDMAWTELVLELAFPGSRSAREELAKVTDQTREIECLFGLLDEFCEEKQKAGLRVIYLKYEKWLRDQDWYQPVNPMWFDLSGRQDA